MAKTVQATAAALDRQIQNDLADVRTSEWALARHLYEFDLGGYWEVLDTYGSRSTYIDALGMSKSRFYRLIKRWRVFGGYEAQFKDFDTCKVDLAAQMVERNELTIAQAAQQCGLKWREIGALRGHDWYGNHAVKSLTERLLESQTQLARAMARIDVLACLIEDPTLSDDEKVRILRELEP